MTVSAFEGGTTVLLSSRSFTKEVRNLFKVNRRQASMCTKLLLAIRHSGTVPSPAKGGTRYYGREALIPLVN